MPGPYCNTLLVKGLAYLVVCIALQREGKNACFILSGANQFLNRAPAIAKE